MSTKAYIDQIKESPLICAPDKWTKKRVYTITGLVSSPESGVEFLAASLVPPILTGHEAIPFIFVVKIASKALSADTCEVTVDYSTDLTPTGGSPAGGTSEPVYEMDSVSLIKTSNVDASGNQLSVSYNGDPQGTTTSRRVAHKTLVVTRIERDIDPDAMSDAFENKYNSKAWHGGEPGSWFCNSIKSRSKDGGTTWSVTYSFEKDTDFQISTNAKVTTPWNPVIYYKDKTTGEPPPDLVWGTGYKEVLYVGSADFNLLGI